MQPLFRKRTTGTAAEFYLRRPENLLLVKREADGGVLICATADNFSAEQRAAFVCYLNEEGFVSVALELPGWAFELATPPVRWIADPTWPQVDPVYLRHLQRLCWCLAGTMVACGLARVSAVHGWVLASAREAAGENDAKRSGSFADSLSKSFYGFEPDFFQQNVSRTVDDVISQIHASLELWSTLVEICYYKDKKLLPQTKVKNKRPETYH